ncbi:hypothetical protein [Rhodopseudomonas telluris]|uniref:Uncharacterized protein n=1 Tax=Rhodopseudomonas telluris TaxID=644215 RepID=A0ABV6EXG3_9BRAD
MEWQNTAFFANGFWSGVLIKDLLPDSCYVCVAVGLAYWSDLFLSKRQFDPAASGRAFFLNYINLVLALVMIFSGVLYFISSLIDKHVLSISFDPTNLIRTAVICLFFTVVMLTFVGEQLLHELELKQSEGRAD